MANVLYAYVPKPGAAAFMQEIGVLQTAAKTEEGGLFVPEKTVTLVPDQLGVFTLDKDDPDFKAKETAILQKAKREKARGKVLLIGPAKDLTKMMEMIHKARPKTAEEKAHLLDAAVADNADLKKRIAELELK